MEGKAKKPCQKELIVKYMRSHGSITRLDAVNDLYVFELPTRIYELKALGWIIDTKLESHTNKYGIRKTFARYSIKEEGVAVWE